MTLYNDHIIFLWYKHEIDIVPYPIGHDNYVHFKMWPVNGYQLLYIKKKTFHSFLDFNVIIRLVKGIILQFIRKPLKNDYLNKTRYLCQILSLVLIWHRRKNDIFFFFWSKYHYLLWPCSFFIMKYIMTIYIVHSQVHCLHVFVY